MQLDIAGYAGNQLWTARKFLLPFYRTSSTSQLTLKCTASTCHFLQSNTNDKWFKNQNLNFILDNVLPSISSLNIAYTLELMFNLVDYQNFDGSSRCNSMGKLFCCITMYAWAKLFYNILSYFGDKYFETIDYYYFFFLIIFNYHHIYI